MASTNFGSLIRAMRAERGWSQDQLAAACDLHANTIRKIERTCPAPDDVKPLTRGRLAHGLGLNDEQLLSLYRRPRIPQQQGDPGGGIPIINRAPAGTPMDYEHMELDNGIGTDYIARLGSGVNDPSAFAFEVVGDSMAPEFRDGEIVVCSPQAEIRDGDAVFVRFGSERDHTCTFKRVFDRGETVQLVPDNRRHQPMIASKEQITRMAKVVAKWVRY